jgi:hypothetical protein
MNQRSHIYNSGALTRELQRSDVRIAEGNNCTKDQWMKCR